MRSITAVQAVQFWVKLAAVAIPAVALLSVWNLDGRPDPVADGAPHFERIVVALAGTLSQCLRRHGGITAFRCGAVLALAAPLALLPATSTQGAATLVTMALSVSACTLCPLLVLGIWWRGLTPAGAAAGLLTGGGLTVTAALTRLFSGRGTDLTAALLAQPALVIAPAVFAIMITASLLTRHRVPRHADRALMKLHLPEDDPGPAPATAGRRPEPAPRP
ncbi:hypothetical protein [Actinomadura livida]|uniref:Na+(H+)/acetate symporter ActP n=1 Tax=Actinomadura livida TaxID=79909 RepID=A0A7W7IG47_9ACTN|nr:MULTISPECIES: hypothetical protein [Actinomadura]MBB4776472.1 Na+(H+)/acetate symporter ActP [Actinomadura catellatispora]GGT92559.1 hypothetical protein GCM10010208_14340 [Actinomadura livida]